MSSPQTASVAPSLAMYRDPLKGPIIIITTWNQRGLYYLKGESKLHPGRIYKYHRVLHINNP